MQMRRIDSQQDLNNYQIELPKPTIQLHQIFSQLKLFSKQRLDTNQSNAQGLDNGQEIKGLKFISSKLTKLFFKNRKLPYNQISKILIDNFASQHKDQRNIKRRVYDAINVLVAAGVLVKKDNYVQMIKNKIKVKIQNQRKGRIQDQLKQKQHAIEDKIQTQNNLLRKHKLINKLFDRNSGLNIKYNKRNQEGTQELKRSKPRKRAHQQAGNSNVLALKDSFSLDNLIYEPKIFISINNQDLDQKDIRKNIIKKFESSNQLSLVVPYLNKTRQLKYLRGQQQCGKNQCRMDQQDHLGQEQQFQQVKAENNQINYFLTKNGVYSLMDLLQLLRLDDVPNH